MKLLILLIVFTAIPHMSFAERRADEQILNKTGYPSSFNIDEERIEAFLEEIKLLKALQRNFNRSNKIVNIANWLSLRTESNHSFNDVMKMSNDDFQQFIENVPHEERLSRFNEIADLVSFRKKEQVEKTRLQHRFKSIMLEGYQTDGEYRQSLANAKRKSLANQ